MLHLTETVTEGRFASFLSGGFTTMAAWYPLENKLEKRTSLQSTASDFMVNF